MARATETTGVPAGEDDLHCQILVLKCMAGLMDTMVLNCAVNLQIFDAIHRHGGQPISLPDLAAALPASRVHHSVLRRVLRYLTNMCLIDLQHPDTNAGNGEDGEYYSLTPAAATYLRVESEKSLVPFLRLNLLEEMITPLFAIDSCVTAELGPDVPAVELLGREKLFSMLERDPAIGKIYNEAMTALLRRTAEAVVEGCPTVFEGVGTVVDVGGGEGLMAAAIARAFPSVKSVVLDLPHVVEKAPEREGVEFVAGDMFVSLPQADALLFTFGYDGLRKEEVMVNMLNVSREFFRLPPSDRRVTYSDDPTTNPRLSTSFYPAAEDVRCWRDCPSTSHATPSTTSFPSGLPTTPALQIHCKA
ncbi:3'-hydroxy-N-methyl-(S)-coclaurine 4'-O-methyltransferase [Apostasia shenzhenica]|uniref:3'-hydroxy-N-methyl-(S)-coclaurine 4'-O-methyltransferase n=1 Tax=Apostasia shenzhenica TaxID=1088818 RepID=A0A2H9ZXX6_9ASPA|nr:3'-hydroxy-N-methyl-(S)-coclaurine 4'-O-methyltransferase [Apostasia shenzhenica]